MAAMHRLVRLMGELEESLTTCMRCGMCQAVCPLYAQTGKEADVARGKLALLDGVLQEMFDRPHSVNERLNKCLLCGSCEANCPSGVSVMEIFIKARAILTGYMGLSTPKKAILRGMLAHPEVLDRVARWGARFQKIVTRPVNNLLGTSCVRMVSPLIGHRHFTPLASEPFHQKIASVDGQTGRCGYKVAFFVGCLIDKIYPRIAQASVEVLDHMGVGIHIPANQGCCGIPAISAGDTETFNRLVRHNLDRFAHESFDYLVTACATCTATIKKIGPLMVRNDRADRAQQVDKLAEKTLDISQFLVEKVGLAASQPGLPKADKDVMTVTYHDPCHLKKSLGVSAEPRILLEAANGYHLKGMRTPDQCCGMGGSFNLQYYDLSNRIGANKRKEIRDTQCRMVATSCPACMMQMSDMLSQAGDQIKVKHVIEIFAESLK